MCRLCMTQATHSLRLALIASYVVASIATDVATLIRYGGIQSVVLPAGAQCGSGREGGVLCKWIRGARWFGEREVANTVDRRRL